MIVLRDSKKRDIENIYNHLNKKYVEKYSKNIDEEKNIYIKWYNFLMNSKYFKLFTVEDLSKNFLGLVKFELEKDFEGAEISIYLSENIRGKKYSNIIINASIEEIKFKFPKLKYVVAYIIEENISSIKAFEKSNFEYKGVVEYKDIEQLLYMKILEAN